MMNKFEYNNQSDANDNTNTDTVSVDVDKAALVNPRYTEEESREGGGGVSVVHSMGHQLQAGRIACNLSIEDVSRQLRLSAKQVEALEKEDFGKLPTGTFLRGFIRNYANLVKLDPKPMLKALPSQTPIITAHTTLNSVQPTSTTSFSSNRAWDRQTYRNGKSQNGLFKVVAAVLFLFVIYGLYHSINWSQLPFIGDGSEKKMGNSIESSVTNGQPTIELQLPIPPASNSVVPNNINNQSIQAIDAEIHQKQKHFSSVESLSAAVSSSSPVGSDFGTLYFKFTNDSWVEVKDQANTVVFKQNNIAGTEQMVSGKRPLSLVISNAEQVNLTYNGRIIDLVPYTNENEGIARLALE